MESILIVIKRYWFLAVTALSAYVVYMWESKNKTISQLKEEVRTHEIGTKLIQLSRESDLSQADYERTKREYDRLRAAHPEYFEKRDTTKP